MILSYSKRFLRLIIGLFLFAVGIYLSILANVGLAPWEAFGMGLSVSTGVSFGNMVVLIGLVIILIDFLLREKIGFGTLLNAVLIGKFVDLLEWLVPLPQMQGYGSGIALLLLGQVAIAVGSFLYIGAALGCGPRDALMVALGKRFSKVPIGLVRGVMEGAVLLIGFLLGGKVGIGTVVAVFGIGVIIQLVFQLFRFDVRAVEHENFADTLRVWRSVQTRQEPELELGELTPETSPQEE